MCGRTSEQEAANFCFYCGASLPGSSGADFVREEKSKPEERQGQNTNQANSYFNRIVSSIKPGSAQAGSEIEKEAPVPFGTWLILLLLPFVPYVGSLIFIVILFLWAFGSKSTKTQKNFSRAMLIFVAVIMVVAANMLSTLMESPLLTNKMFGL